MRQKFNLRQRQTCVLVATICLGLGEASAAACPSASGGQILVDNLTVTATCVVPNAQSIVVTSTGEISTSYPNPAILIAGGVDMQAIHNSGSVHSTGNALQVQGTVRLNITNNNIIAGTGITAGQVSEGIRLDLASVEGAILNNSGASIIAANGNAIHLTGSNLDGGIQNAANAEIGSAGGYAAVLIENFSEVYNGIVNAGHIGPSAVGSQNGSGLQIVGSFIYGNINNSGTIDARGSYAAVRLDNSSVYNDISQTPGALINSGTIDASTGTNAIELVNNSQLGTIRNTGNISAASSGISVSGSTVATGIINDGLIIAGQDAIRISSGTIGGGIANTGTISSTNLSGIHLTATTLTGGIHNHTLAEISSTAGYAAILIDGGSTVTGDIVNEGYVGPRTGQDGRGVQIVGSTVNGDITNSGTINTSNSSVGVDLDNSTVTGALRNSGTIGTATGGAGVELVNASSITSITNTSTGTIRAAYPGIYVSNSTVTDGITNAGTINAMRGIQLENGAVVGASGVRNATGATIHGSDRGISVVNSTIDGAIDNAGAITSTVGAGIEVSGTSTIGGGIVNSGTIGGVAALLLANTGTAFTVSNSGTLNGNVQLGINRLDILGNGTVSGNVVGDAGSIVNIGTDATRTTNFTPTGNFSGLGQFNIGQGSTLGSRSGLAIGATTVTNAGVLSIAAGHAVSVTGNYTQSAGGVLRTGFDSASSFGRLNVSGNASLASGTGVDVDVSQAAVLAIGSVAAGVVTAGGTLSGVSSATVTDNSYLFNFTASSADGKTLDLTAVSATPAPPPAPAPPSAPAPAPPSAIKAVTDNGNTAGRGAAAVFDGLITAGATGDMASVITALGKLATAKDVSEAISQTLPVATGATPASAASTMKLTDDVVRARVDVVHTGGPDGDDSAQAPDRGIWFTPVGAWTRQQTRDGVDGYRAQSGGMVLGADTAVSASDRVGGAFSYSRASIDNRGVASQSAHIDIYRLMAYGRHDIDDSTFVGWQGDVGTTRTSGDRSITFGGLARKAESDYSGTVAHVGADVGRVFLIDSATQFTPSLRADYAVVRNKAYTETGAGALNLSVQGQKAEQFLLAAHGKFTRALSEGLQLSGNLGLGYDFLAKRNRVVSTFVGGGASFVTEGLSAQRFVANGGVELTVVKAKGLELTARYDVELRRSFSNQSIGFKLAKKF